MSADASNKPKFDMGAYVRSHLGPKPIVSVTRFVSEKNIREDDEADCDGDDLSTGANHG